MAQRILPDANVLFSRTIRDWLFLLQASGGTELYSLFWTEDISAEVISKLRERYPELPGGSVRRLREKMEQSMEGGLVEHYDVHPVPGLTDEKDWHVIAAAQACEAHVLVTVDQGILTLDDSTADALNFDIFHPDDFFILVHDSAPGVTRAIAQQQLIHWTSRLGRVPPTAFLSDRLSAADCPHFASVILGITTQLPIPALPRGD